MRNAVLLALAFCSAAAEASNWVDVTEDSDGAVFSVETDRLARTGRYRKTWVRTTLVKPERIPKSADKFDRKAKFYSVSASNAIYDCDLRSRWIMKESFRDAEGNEVAEIDVSRDGPYFVEPEPSTVGEALVDFVCKA